MCSSDLLKAAAAGGVKRVADRAAETARAAVNALHQRDKNDVILCSPESIFNILLLQCNILLPHRGRSYTTNFDFR